MPAAIPLIDHGDMGAFYAPGPAAQAPAAGANLAASAAVGTGDLSGSHNTPLHMAGLLLVGLAVIIGLKYMGFRFVVDAGVGR